MGHIRLRVGHRPWVGMGISGHQLEGKRGLSWYQGFEGRGCEYAWGGDR